MLYTTYTKIRINNASVDDVVSKEINPNSASSYRLIPSESINDLDFALKSNDVFNIELFDISGRLVYKDRGNIEDILSILNSKNNWGNSMYVIYLRNSNDLYISKIIFKN
jgi:hypothetical protein